MVEYREYYWIALTIGALLILIFMNTLRMYFAKKESEQDSTINEIDIEVNEQRIAKNKRVLNKIRTSVDGLESDIDDLSDELDQMGTDADLTRKSISDHAASIESIKKTMSDLKTADDNLERADQELIDRDSKMNEEWLKQFNYLVDVQQENNDEIMDVLDDRFIFVNVSEESSMRINELENTIKEAEEKLDGLRDELQNAQFF